MQVRRFSEAVTYHPKVFPAHDRAGKPSRFLLGSANLSGSAFTHSVEAGVLSTESTALRTLTHWFDDLFKKRSQEFTPESLRLMEERWRAAAVARARAYLRVKRELVIPARAPTQPISAEDFDTLEDVFATLQLPIGLLCMDYAGNTIRNIKRSPVVAGMANTRTCDGQHAQQTTQRTKKPWLCKRQPAYAAW